MDAYYGIKISSLGILNYQTVGMLQPFVVGSIIELRAFHTQLRFLMIRDIAGTQTHRDILNGMDINASNLFRAIPKNSFEQNTINFFTNFFLENCYEYL